MARRILVVEDAMLIAELLAELLTDHGYEVVGPAPRLSRALAYAKQERLDGALLDVNLAGEQCFPVASLLAVRDIPFAFLSGYGEGVIPPEFQGAPRLSKPVHPGELLRSLGVMLGGG